MNNKLTIKQEKFCDKYVECGNASEAYRFAYSCGKMKDKTIWERASSLLNDSKVTARINEIKAELAAESKITKERILEELTCILDATIADYVKIQDGIKMIDGVEKELQEVVFKNFDELTPKQLRAVESVKQGRNGIELKLHGKSWTIERICKMLGFDAPSNVELTGKDGKPLHQEPLIIEVIDRTEQVDKDNGEAPSN